MSILDLLPRSGTDPHPTAVAADPTPTSPDHPSGAVVPGQVGPRPERLPRLLQPTPAGLGDLARALGTRRDLWRRVLRIDPTQRWSTRVAGGEGWEAWLVGWAPGQATGLHDHTGPAGAFIVLDGRLTERAPDPRRPARRRDDLTERVLVAGQVRTFSAGHVHEVVASGPGPAASLHVYAPTLRVANRFELDPVAGLTYVQREPAA